MPAPTPKENWLAGFVNELYLTLRPDIGLKFAEKIAINAWARCKNMAPADAARQWADELAKKRNAR